jgi:hypothetical protein
MDVRQLHDEADKLQVRAKNVRSDAYQAQVSADGLNGRGDQDAARIEAERAKQLEKEAAELERQAQQMSLEAEEKIKRANDIERKQEQIQKDAAAAVENLEKEKRSLTGNSTGLFG